MGMSGWLGAGAFAAGLSAAVLVGAGAAHADERDSSGPGPAAAAVAGADTAQPDTPLRVTEPDVDPPGPGGATTAGAAADEDRGGSVRTGTSDPDDLRSARDPEESESELEPREEAAQRDEVTVDSDAATGSTGLAEPPTASSVLDAVVAQQETAAPDPVPSAERATQQRPSHEQRPADDLVPTATTAPAGMAEQIGAPDSTGVELASTQPDLGQRRDASRARLDQGAETLSPSVASVASVTSVTSVTSATSVAADFPFFGPFQPHYSPILRFIGSLIFNLLGALVQFFDGPPVVPPTLRDRVQTSSSTLVIAEGAEVQADWYFPTHGRPDRIVYLQHGFLASGPMYSYTASYLADATNSIVVATSITSNLFADNNMWLGGDALHQAVARLFLADGRTALTASLTTAELKIGRDDLTVPDKFVLVGHSLGGGFAPGVAGHYAGGVLARRTADPAGTYDNDLEGVVLLDAVPFDPVLPNAMRRLAQLESSGDPDDYVPVYEIGAPVNLLNSLSTVNTELPAARPGKFNGVVVNGGVHMDGMRGGNLLIQLSAYLIAGIPQRQNPDAVQTLMDGWINDMFANNIDPVTGRCLHGCRGSYGDPGATIVIPTGMGDATAVVIGPVVALGVAA